MAQKNLLKALPTLFFFAVIVYFVYVSFVYIQVFAACMNTDSYTNNEFMRVKVYGNSDTVGEETISATFSIVNSTGTEIASIERSWNNRYLAIKFVQVSFRGSYYIFPQKIYGKDYIMENSTFNKKVTNLDKYYNENSQSLLLGPKATKYEKYYLYVISRFANKKIPLFKLGLVSSFVIDLSECKSGVYYSICLNEKGKVVAMEL